MATETFTRRSCIIPQKPESHSPKPASMSSYFHTPTRISNIVTGLNNNNNKGLELHNWGNVNSGLVMKAGSGIPCLGVYEVGYKVFGHLIDTVGINE